MSQAEAREGRCLQIQGGSPAGQTAADTLAGRPVKKRSLLLVKQALGRVASVVGCRFEMQFGLSLEEEAAGTRVKLI